MIEYITKFLDFVDNRAIFRRIAFVIVLVMTWRITEWAMTFAEHWLNGTKTGMDAAAMIGAITVPFATLQGAVLKIYSDSRGQ